MASSEEKLGHQLVEAGKTLLPPPASVDELLRKLGHIEALLIEVAQSPPKSMLDAIITPMKALVANELIKHSDIDVKVAVACCISEITRITAPEAPYDDEKMKVVFELIVSSFEDLSDKSSRSYTRRTSILETVAKVRSCVIMLDLECEWLIADMFQHFLKTIRDYHPDNVFSAMVAIMVLVLEESEDISLELLSPVLAILKKDNQEILPVARKLAERVFENCAAKIKQCLVQAVDSEALSLDEYSNVVAGICGVTCVKENGGPAHGEPTAEEKTLVESSSHDVPQAEENILVESSTNDISQVDEGAVMSAPSENLVKVADETVDDEPSKDPVPDGSQVATINGSAEEDNEGPSARHESSIKLEISKHTDEFVGTNESNAVVSLTSDSTKEIQIELQPEQSMERIINMSEDGHHADKKSDTSGAINAESDGGQHSDQLDNNMASKAGSSDLGSTKVVKLKLKSEETTRRGSKKPEEAQETVQVTEINEIESGDLESSKIVKSKSKSEQTGKTRSKKPDDVTEAGKAESADVCSIKVLKLKMKSEETARGSSKTPEDAVEVSKAESGEMDRSKLATESKSEQSSKKISKKQDEGPNPDQLIDTNEATKAESVELNNTKVIKPETKSGQTTTGRKRRRKLNSFSTREPSGSSFVDDAEKEAGKLSDLHNEEVPCGPSEDLPSEKAKLSGNAQKTEQTCSPSQSGTPPNENQPKKSALVNKKSKQGAGTSAEVSEGPSDSEVRHKRQTGKKVPVRDTTESKTTPAVSGKGKKIAVIDKKDVSSSIDISSLRRKGVRKGRQGKGNSDKDMTSKSSSKDDKKALEISTKSSKKLHDEVSEDDMVEIPKIKSKTKRNSGKEKEPQFPIKPSSTLPEDVDDSDETPKISSKRKRSGKDEASGAIKYDDSLVGLKVKVWWPDDAQFYLGVIDSFDSVKRKHKVLYDDGDEETLILKKERWELVKDGSKIREEEDVYESSDEPSDLLQKKKSKAAEKTSKQGKTNTSGAKKSLSKSKVAATKSGKKSSEDDNDTDEDKTTDSKLSLKSDSDDEDIRPKELSQKTVKKPIGSNNKLKASNKSKVEKKVKGKIPDDSEKESNTSEDDDEEEAAVKKSPEKKGKPTGKVVEKKGSVAAKSGGASSKRTKKRKRN